MEKGIKHLIFDLGGVLLNIDLQRISRGFGEILSFDEEAQQRFRLEISPAYETGKISTTQFLLEVSKNLRNGYTENDIIRIWNSIILEMPPDRLEMLVRLRQNYQVHLLSNINPLHADCFEEKFISWFNRLPRHYFDQFFYSHEIGKRKPDKSTYAWVLEQINAIGSETIFIDDMLENIEGAKSAGLIAHQLQTNKEDVIYLVKNLGLY